MQAENYTATDLDESAVLPLCGQYLFARHVWYWLHLLSLTGLFTEFYHSMS